MANKLEPIYHNLSVMLEAGVPIIKALRHSGEAGQRHWRRAFYALADRAAEGDSLADAMQKNPRRFVPLDVQLVQVGEESGNLPLMLGELSGWYALCNKLNRTIRSGMTLPLLIFHFVAFIVPIIFYFISSFRGGNMTVDDAFGLSILILSLFYVPAAIILFIIKCTPKTGPLRWLLDLITLYIPFVGYAFKHLALSRFCRNFHLCYSAGVPMLQTCQIAMDGSGNVVVGSWFKPTLEMIRDGNSVSEGLPTRRLSAEFLASWENGEEAGKLDTATQRLASHASERSENMFHEISVWLPRIFYFLVALLIIYFIFVMASMAFAGISSMLD